MVVSRLIVLTILALGTAVPGPAMADGDFSGQWSGAIVMQPAVMEVAITVEFSRVGDTWHAEGKNLLEGTTTVFESVAVEGTKITFSFEANEGTRVFEGQLSEDGRHLEGTCTGVGRAATFSLVRQTGPPAKTPELRDIPGDGKEFAKIFDADRGKVRLLMLVSPSCNPCRVSADLVQRYVLDKISDKRLRLYVIWAPILENDFRQTAESALWTITDPRAQHFWAKSLGLPEAFQGPLGLVESLAWDVELVFEKNAVWSAPAPLPQYVMHRSQQLPSEDSFNGMKLADEVRELLAKSGSD